MADWGALAAVLSSITGETIVPDLTGQENIKVKIQNTIFTKYESFHIFLWLKELTEPL